MTRHVHKYSWCHLPLKHLSFGREHAVVHTSNVHEIQRPLKTKLYYGGIVCCCFTWSASAGAVEEHFGFAIRPFVICLYAVQ